VDFILTQLILVNTSYSPAISTLKTTLDEWGLPDKEHIDKIFNEIRKSDGYMGLLNDSENDTSLEFSDSDKIFILNLIENEIMSLETFTNIVKRIPINFVFLSAGAFSAKMRI